MRLSRTPVGHPEPSLAYCSWARTEELLVAEHKSRLVGQRGHRWGNGPKDKCVDGRGVAAGTGQKAREPWAALAAGEHVG